MKKLFFFLCSLTLGALSLVSCGSVQPAEAFVPASAVETLGTGFKTFAADGELRVFSFQTPSGKWSIRVTAPLRRVSDEKVEALNTSIDLFDQNGVRLNDAFELTGQDIASILPVLNDADKPVRNVTYMAMAELEGREASRIVSGVKSVHLNLEAAVSTPEEVKKKEEKKEFPYEPTVQNLVAYYGIRGILRQYETAYSNKDKSRCKQIKNKLDNIESAVREHPRGGKRIANDLEDWMDDQIDEIEDKVDDRR